MKKIPLWIIAALLLLSGCQPPKAMPVPSTPPAPTQPPPTQTPIQLATATKTSAPPTPTATPRVLAERVLIISVDGLRGDVIYPDTMPNTHALIERGAYAANAYTTFPSSTLPAHASMLTGMCPEKHLVDWNDYLPQKGYAASPSLFEIAHQTGLQTAMIVGKEKLRQITPPENTDIFKFINDRDSIVVQAAIPHLNDNFDLFFIHLPLVDMLGHEYGWLSPNYMIGTFRADEAIGMILAALDKANLREGTLILITSDHGGHSGQGASHGTALPEDMHIPWIASGAGIHPTIISRPISTVDTAASISYALGLPIPATWDGVPVYEAFGEPASARAERPCQP